MGKPPRRAALPCWRLAPVAAAVLVLVSTPARAGWEFRPAVDLRETYTDNVSLQSADLAESQFVTELTPSLAIIHRGAHLSVNALVRVHAFGFSDHRVSGANRSSKEFQGSAHATLIDDLFYVDASGSRAERTISAFGQQYTGNDYSNANRTPVTTYSFSPYLVKRFGSSANLELRYSHDSVDGAASLVNGAGSVGGLGTTGIGNSKSDTLSARLVSGAAFRTVSWSASYSDQTLDDAIAESTRTQILTTTARYQLRPTFALTGMLGYDKFDYNALGGVTQGKSYSGGFAWNPSTRTSLEASVGHRYVGGTKMLNAMHRSRLTVWNINYDDSITNSRNNFLLPATIDTTSMLNQLFAVNFPDPLERQRAVAEYIRLSGLPSQLQDSVNYFSNRFYLQKQLRASVAVKTARTVVLASVFHTRRNALSTQQSDSTLLGSFGSTLNDDTKQVGASLTMNYRLSSRTALNAGQTNSTSDSLTTGVRTSSKLSSVSLSHTLARGLTGAVELRRTSGNVGSTPFGSAFGAGRTYRENALSASLSLQL